jgi:hypothetical protein
MNTKWKSERQVKSAKKQSVKRLMKEGSSYSLAKKLVEDAYNRIKK